jgi:hypothetical protein
MEVGMFPSVWSEEQAYVSSFSIRRGRDDYLADYQPGSATLELVNGNGRYSPDYIVSPLYGNITVGRAIWITALLNGTPYSLFYGYIESIVPHPMANQQSCTIQCVDALARLSLIRTTRLDVAALSGTLINNVLDGILWPALKRDINAGQSTFASQYFRVTLLAQLQDIARNEAGFCFASKTGTIVYRDRLTRITGAPSSTSQGTFNNSMTDFQSELAARDIYNEVEVIYNTGPVRVVDPVSQSNFGERTLTLQTQWIGAAEALDHANFVLGFRAAPHTRGRMVIMSSDDTLLLHIVNRELNDRITVIQSFPIGITADFFIEAIEIQASPGGRVMTCTWQLSPANSSAYWLLGVLNYTEVGEEGGGPGHPDGATRPAY